MNKLIRFAAVLAAYICITAAAMAQNAGTGTNHAFLLGKGIGQQGNTSLLCASAQLAVGQTAADPICRTLTGDVTISAGGVTAIGATVVHSAMLNADVFSTAHPWSAIQSLSTLIDLSAIAAPATPASGHGSAWFDSTDLRLHDKNASGTIGTTVVASTCATHQWDSSLSSAGVRTCTQPGFSDLSGSLTTAQLPGLASALIWVGNGSGVAAAVSMSADCSLSNTGAITCTKTNGVAFGPFATIASQTSNVIYKGNGAAAPVVSGLTDDGTKVSTSENIDLTSKAAAIEVANAGTTGTTLNMLAKLSGAPSTALITATTDTGGAIGVVVAGAGTTGNAVVAVQGSASCIFDGATVAGDYVQISGTVAGNCHDAGSTYPSANQVIGRVMSTNGAGGTFVVLLNDEIKAAAGGGGGISSITPGGGLVSAITVACSQTAITTAGTLSQAECVNAQVGTTYTFVDGDRAKLVTASNAAAQAYSLPQAGAASAFAGGWFVDVHNVSTNAAGIVTVTPTTSTINGTSILLIYPAQSVRIISDGTNYQTALAPSLRSLTSSLGSNVALNSAGTYIDGPSVAQGTAGTWFASGTVTLNNTAGASNISCKLWDGTTVMASSKITNTVSSTSDWPMPLSGVITNPAGNIRISCADALTSGLIIFNVSGQSKDSTITAMRIN